MEPTAQEVFLLMCFLVFWLSGLRKCMLVWLWISGFTWRRRCGSRA